MTELTDLEGQISGGWLRPSPLSPQATEKAEITLAEEGLKYNIGAIGSALQHQEAGKWVLLPLH